MRKTNRKKKYKTLLESIKKGLSSWIRLIKDLYGRLTIEIKTFLLKLLYYSAIKRNEIGSSVETWMDLESVIQSEVSQKEKYKYSILTCICRTQKNCIDDLICKAEIETQTQRTNVWIPRGKRGDGRNWEIGIDIYTLLCIKQITNENLLYSMGNSAWCCVVT